MSRPLRFLHVTTFFPPYHFGGDGVNVHRLCNALGEAGHSVDVIHCEDSFRLFHSRDPEAGFANHPNVKVHTLRSGAGWLAPLVAHQTGRPLLHRAAITEILDRGFDVVHYHNISLLGPDVLRMSPRGNPCLKVYTTHEHWLICPMHVLWKYNSRPCEKPDCLSCTLRGNRPPQVWRWTGMLEEATSHVDLFISPSRFTAGIHAERGFERPFAVIPTFVPYSSSEPSLLPPLHDRPYFLFVGRLEVIKGLHTVVDLWKNIADYDLLVAGDGVCAGELKQRAEGNPRIRFLGMQSQEQLAGLYRQALATIVPSITYEVFCQVSIESLMQGTPIIALDRGGLREVVQDSGAGFLYRTDQELAECIRRIGESPELRNELGQRGREAHRLRWSKQVHLDTYFGHLRESAQKKLGFVPWEGGATGGDVLRQEFAKP